MADRGGYRLSGLNSGDATKVERLAERIVDNINARTGRAADRAAASRANRLTAADSAAAAKLAVSMLASRRRTRKKYTVDELYNMLKGMTDSTQAALNRAAKRYLKASKADYSDAAIEGLLNGLGLVGRAPRKVITKRTADQLLEALAAANGVETAGKLNSLAGAYLRATKGRKAYYNNTAQLKRDIATFLAERGYAGRARAKPVYTGVRKPRKASSTPWYWRLSNVKVKGTDSQGRMRLVNKTYRDGLVQVMKDYARKWKEAGNFEPIHGGLFARHGYY